VPEIWRLTQRTSFFKAGFGRCAGYLTSSAENTGQFNYSEKN